MILDWKRSKEIKSENKYQSLQSPLQHLQHTNMNAYSLQLNLYRYMLQSEYDISVEELYIVVLHEINEGPWVVPAWIMEEEVEMILRHEQDQHRARHPTAGRDAPFLVS